MPLTNALDFPACAASSIGFTSSSGRTCRWVLEEHRAAADDVDACGKDAPVILECVGQAVVGHRGVNGAVRLGRQHGIEICRRGDPRRDIKARKLSGVLPGLGIRGDPHAR